MPTAVTLAARRQLRYDDRTATLTIPDDTILYEVDGQHRLAGFRVAIDEQGYRHLEDFPVVTVILDNTNEALEAEQFRLINETAKKVRTDLARRILVRVARMAPVPLRKQVVRERKWEVLATEIIELLQHDPNSHWYGRIQSPNQRRARTHIIKEKSFGDSLRPLLTSYPFENYSVGALARGVNEFWQAWKLIMDEASDSTEYPHPFEQPQEFVLLKAIPGVFALHLVCRHLWSVFERRRERFEADRIAQALRAASEFVRRYGQEDADFTTRRVWHSEEGSFAPYGGMKGAHNLADLIIEYLNEAGYSLDMVDLPE